MGRGVDQFVAARDLLLDFRLQHSTAAAMFRWPELDSFNWALDYFDGLASTRGTDVALRIVSSNGNVEQRSFLGLMARSNQVANLLREAGARRGDRLLMVLGNTAALWEVMLAAMKLGVVVIPSTTLLSADDLADRMERAAVSHVVADEGQIEKFSGLKGDFSKIVVGSAPGWQPYADADTLPPSFLPDGVTRAVDPLLLYFTSGTTSKPKLVQHTHASYPVGHLSTMYWIGLRPGDVHLNISSPGWAKHAWSSFFAPWNAEASVLVLDQPRFDPVWTLGVLGREAVSTFCAPPTVWRMLIQEDLSAYPVQVREAVSAGEPLNPEVIERIRAAWGVTVRDGFGQTETTALIGNPPGLEVRAGSVGKPLPGYRIVLLDPDGRPADEGEIALDLEERPTGLMTEYRGDVERTAAAQADGYYRTGDVATRDGDGYFTYVGRADDVFKASDYRISPFELESVLVEHEAVVEAAVVPSPDPVRLAVPKAFVVLAAGWSPTEETAADIFRFARERLAPYKRLRRLEFAELPKTISGKIRRVELRRGEQDRDLQVRRAQEYWEEDLPAVVGQ